MQDSTKINQEDKKDLCKVILNNGSTTVVQTKESETIQQLVNRVLNKRGITYGLYEVYVGTNRKVKIREYTGIVLIILIAYFSWT